MTDVFHPDKRSEIMSRIKGRGNRSTEIRLRFRLVSAGIRGWRMHPAHVTGKPDFTFNEPKLAVFLDGCFWHGCSSCRNIPKNNRGFWQQKIGGNRRRDREVTRKLKAEGWKVLRFWEHEMRKPSAVLKKIRKALCQT